MFLLQFPSSQQQGLESKRQNQEMEQKQKRVGHITWFVLIPIMHLAIEVL